MKKTSLVLMLLILATFVSATQMNVIGEVFSSTG